MSGALRNAISRLLLPHGVEMFGFCRYEDLLPLLSGGPARRLPPSPRSVIVCLFPYYTGEYPLRNLSRYAIVNDYHTVAGGILQGLCSELSSLHPEEHFASFVDASPIREVEAARLAGLGDVGKNNLLLTERYGSYVFIGTVVTTLELRPFLPPGGNCDGCGLCISACPTKALTGSIFLRERCRSYTTQKKSPLTEWEISQIREGGFVWGCDCCLNACPHNRDPVITPIPGFLSDIEPTLTPENLDRLYLEKPYNYRKKDVLRRNLEILSPQNGEA